MSYQVLARKWRPQNFKQMVGQEHVLRALINALDSDRLHHAYLFTGTRGVGKTTIARILAKCLNCETGITSEPCCKCNSCQEIAAGNFLDLIEVDAASRTKVEDTRELLENVQYAPTRARFKVYLIDEVHMLTGHSFNALLKTLEEPPPHVKFLFATTDPQKLPATILSRCLQFNLKRMPVDMISRHLAYLLKEESIDFEEPSLKLIARAADGSMRDALSLLDHAIAFSGEKLTEASVRDMLGTISHEPLIDLLKSVSEGEGASILKQVEELSSVTPDFEAAADALISLLHQLAVQQVVPDALSDEESIEDLARSLSKEDVQLFYQIALQGRRDMSLSPDPRSGFEMLLLRMMSFKPLTEGMHIQQTSESETSTNFEDVSKKKTVNPEFVVKKNSSITAFEEKPMQAVTQEQTTIVAPPPWEEMPEELQDQPQQHFVTPEIDSRPSVDLKLEWHEVVPQLQLSGRAAELIKHCLLASQENGIIALTLDQGSESLLADTIRQEIETALLDFYGSEYKLELTIADATVDAAQNEGSSPELETPAQRNIRKTQESQQQAEENIETDPFVIELKNRFGAQIVPGSVQPK